MKIGTLESALLLTYSVFCDALNIGLYLAFGIGIFVNTVLNVFLGTVFILWFKIRSQITESDAEEGSDPAESYIRDEKDRLKRLYRQSQEEKKSVGTEVSPSTESTEGSGANQLAGQEAENVAGRETEQLAERSGAETAEHLATQTGKRVAERTATQTAEQVATQTGERVATGVAERTAAQTAERVAVQTSEKVAVGIIGRILGATYVAKIIPVLNAVPLWTISTVLLLRQNKKERQKIEDEKFAT